MYSLQIKEKQAFFMIQRNLTRPKIKFEKSSMFEAQPFQMFLVHSVISASCETDEKASSVVSRSVPFL